MKNQLSISGKKSPEATLKNYWSSLFKHFGPYKVFLWVLESFFNMLLSPLPIIPGSAIRRLAYRLLFKNIGKGMFTSPGVKFLHSYNISIGDRCSLNYNSMLNGRGGLTIGDDFTTGPGVVVWTVEHHYKDKNRKVLEQGEYDAPVNIGNDVWCGANVVILPGVNVADGTVAAAGAVITKDTEPYSVVAGVPAKVVDQRVSEEKEK